jgi:sugar phosphate isomerase/epimerase
MKTNQIAAQLYTIRDFIKTSADIAASLKKLRAIGYRAVQVSAMGPIAEEELLKILDGEGLTCCATHEPSDTILNEPQRVAERLRKLRCRITAYPSPKGITLDTLADAKAFAAKLNAAGKTLAEVGVTLCYHNHHIEFRRVDGRVVLDVIYAETDPRYLQGEPDTYWIQYGGGDPVEWCVRLKNRLPIIHLKDFAITKENQIAYTEVGNGNLNWARIIPAAQAAGCQWFCVEQDTCPADPFDSLKQSFDYLKENLCSN